MASSSVSGSKLAEDLKGLKEQKAAELKKEKGRRVVAGAEQGHGPSPGRDYSPVLW